jgi:hypothetical protein
MTEIKLTKRYPNSRTEDITDAYMRGWNDALDAVQNGKFIINDDRKTEPQKCEGCKHWIDDRWGWFCCQDECNFEPKDVPHDLDDVGRQIQAAYDKGVISDASAIQAWYTAVNKTEPQTERSE